MSHHGNDHERASEFLDKMMRAERGSTGDPLRDAMRETQGEFPDGRLSQHDEGAIPMEVGHHSGKVIVRFPKPATWIGLTGDGAMELAQCLIQHARAVGITKPITFEIGS